MGETVDPVLGDPSIAERASRHRAKGSLVAARARWVREKFGEAELARLVERVEGPARQHLVEPPLPFAWYPFEHLVQLDVAMIEGPLGGDVSRIRDFGDDIARYDLSTLYKVMFKLGTPSFIIRRIGVVYGQYLDGGRARGESAGAGEARVTVEDATFPLYFCEHGISGWLRAAVDLSGGERVRIEQDACVHRGDAACGWRLRWE